MARESDGPDGPNFNAAMDGQYLLRGNYSCGAAKGVGRNFFGLQIGLLISRNLP
jgi:hypothetical protein